METRPKITRPQTPTGASAERVAWGALVLLWALAVWSYFHLPDIVPVHYNLAGQVDRYGEKGSVLVLSLVATALFGGLTALSRFPHALNSLMTTPSNLQRFVDAQASSYQTALAEINTGRKRSHWMWYVFPQIQGLGFSETAHHYALADVRAAADYLAHPVLGSRLLEISRALLGLASSDARHVLGSPDDLKLRSSMTLFASLRTNPVFQQVLDKFYGGTPDDKTLRILAAQ